MPVYCQSAGMSNNTLFHFCFSLFSLNFTRTHGLCSPSGSMYMYWLLVLLPHNGPEMCRFPKCGQAWGLGEVLVSKAWLGDPAEQESFIFRSTILMKPLPSEIPGCKWGYILCNKQLSHPFPHSLVCHHLLGKVPVGQGHLPQHSM